MSAPKPQITSGFIDRFLPASVWGAVLVLCCLQLVQAGGPVELTLADHGRTGYVIALDTLATPQEVEAARELAEGLLNITGVNVPAIRTTDAAPPAQSILVGRSRLAMRAFSDLQLSTLGPEECVIQSRGSVLLLAGGSPRGTIYAVNRFLQDTCGVRHWTPWAAYFPKRSVLRIPPQSRREHPAFEYREPFWMPSFDTAWSVQNQANGPSNHLDPAHGGAIRYKGFVHTFYPLVPPEQHFAAHPEWFSLVKGQRSTNRAQLCLTQPGLRDFVTQQVRSWMKETPDANILSISQNDWYGACECGPCKALDEREGSHSGTMLDFVNDIAGRIEAEFPNLSIDTLAYQYTRHPPKTLRPRRNVIVRLCSIECNFREAMDHPSNRAFMKDLADWAKIAPRLYIWDYSTDFGHYVQPHPNWFSLGDTLRIFHQNQVRGVFSEGAYQSHGSEFAELRAWVLAQLLWDPYRDTRALIDEFLEGYYGTGAAPYIRNYLQLMHVASTGHNLTCYSGLSAPHLKFGPLSQGELLWQKAEAAAYDPELRTRVRLGRLPLLYVWLSRWDALRKECAATGGVWPLPEDKAAVIALWSEIANGVEGKPWTRVTQLNEAGLKPDAFLRRVQNAP